MGKCRGRQQGTYWEWKTWCLVSGHPKRKTSVWPIERTGDPEGSRSRVLVGLPCFRVTCVSRPYTRWVEPPEQTQRDEKKVGLSFVFLPGVGPCRTLSSTGGPDASDSV